ncbi:hypothetical protein JMJ56_21980 [Belnapia sp. T18]|uniref:Uncharacterized protein n=1 Tax=Belnapia arida TaxID=2804533 RepID=A0ABS1U7M9_9PROT|nr:hypothetical protein [Belnapia arida]MBL6080690.1 hypothetical protein [Belnapia arida]
MTTTLSIQFEGGDLFALAHVDGLADQEEARCILDAEPRLSFDDGWASLACAGREPRRLCPYDCDEVGRWPLGVDRTCSDELRAASLPMPDFMALHPETAELRPVWFGIVSWERDESGVPVRLISSASGSIGTLARD